LKLIRLKWTKNVKQVAVLADVKESLTALLPFIEGKTHESWHNKLNYMKLN
jgi:hypothetical protein